MFGAVHVAKRVDPDSQNYGIAACSTPFTVTQNYLSEQ
jgi:hypothetical protein